MNERYYVTNAGLAAALNDTQAHADVEAALHGVASADLVKRMVEKGWLASERRPAQVDNSLLVLSGALARLREVLPADRPTNGTPTTPPAELVSEDLRTLPRKLYRLRSDRPTLAKDHLRQLPSGARRVYAALQRSDIGTTKSLAEVTGLNRRTVENALGALRKAGLLEDFDYTR